MDAATIDGVAAEGWTAWETALRLGPALLAFVLFSSLESLFPKRPRRLTRTRRWSGNLSLVVISAFLVKLLVPLPPVAAALWAAQQGWGLLPWIGLDPHGVIAFVITLVLFDLAIYGQHVLTHHFPPLWRLHRLHHSDTDLDTSSAFRFHPLEIVLSVFYKTALVLLLGAPALAVLVFEALLNASAQFNHANWALPERADKALRQIIVTPDMHRVHHSWTEQETNSNYGFCFPWWDRLFGTYRAAPAEGQDGMTVGLEGFRDPEENAPWRMIAQPLRTLEPKKDP
ncbi:MAG: sterol desaturase family protein [Rhodospirillaceae bacterium]